MALERLGSPLVSAWQLLGIATGVFVADRTTKALALRLLPRARALGVLRVTRNPYGSLAVRAPGGAALLALWLVAVACTSIAVAAAPGPLAGAGLAAAIGGATGNLCDRLGRGAVVDFVALGRWPAFNLADVAVVAGVAASAWAAI